MPHCIVNDIDGDTFHAVDSGPLDEVRGRADERLRRQIDDALARGGKSTETHEGDDGEVYTTKVVIQ